MLLSKRCNWCLRHELFVIIVAYYYKKKSIWLACFVFNTCAKRAGAWSCLIYKVVHAKPLIKCTSWLTWFSSSRNEEKSKRKKGRRRARNDYHRIYTELYVPFIFSFFLCLCYVRYSRNSLEFFLHTSHCDRFKRISRCMLATGSIFLEKIV